MIRKLFTDASKKDEIIICHLKERVQVRELVRRKHIKALPDDWAAYVDKGPKKDGYDAG
ncbi:hypothetical protein [Sporolactobacillus pectinivorans]|uniref:hypothetical protein n=1 Tax=Sporolactobacillus pectinivorans TaxID=1591408 RepID=UPI0012FE32AE|nr:hypothetical protein [Sporolactobacillus pectinivorans]